MKKRVQTENGGEQRKDISDTGAWIGKVGSYERERYRELPISKEREQRGVLCLREV